MITLLVTDRNLNVLGDPITQWTDIDITLRFNEPDSGSVALPTGVLSPAQLAPGNRLVVIRDGAYFTAGPIETPGALSWSVRGGDSGPGTTTLTFASDLASIVAEVAYPDPARAITAQTVARRTFTNANAEAVMRQLVTENVGPAALAARRIPGLSLGAVAGVGSAVTFGFRLDQLGDALRAVALAGGGLGFRTRWTGTGITFEVYQPRDLRAQVRYSRGLGNLRGYEFDPAAPTATVAIVGATGEAANRAFSEFVSPAAATWGRMVTVVDQRTAEDPAEIVQAGAEALAQGAESARLTADTVDTATQRYGTHYGLGDLVSIELNNGVELADIVRAVNLKATPATGEVVTSTIGTQSASVDPDWVRLLRDLARRLGRLEAI
ncbi:ReqiPepy6 Gp37-like protein [Micromonospora sp. M71_S20]|uniref:siphovirus ReqiPepy6 Gp37-like family protein n=1 Tax=Micromonospora sp. M71_S20 TaxID=592872 RepID=UPI000EAC6D23|nr:siphovirus ReqiPepy6 Gp37-like family protein [Micromonospora sp. M71_S20]RLK22645.1 ReqiPepy6 Gp37-like protein [Micromonospora sp. M71_S20]